MGVELFGSGAIVPIAMVCVVSYVFSSHRSIYTSQRVAVSKGGRALPGTGLIGGLRSRQRPGRGSGSVEGDDRGGEGKRQDGH
jgi:hypothetical protein